MLEKFRFRQIPRRYSHCLYLDDASRYIRFFVTLWRIRDWSWCLIPGARVAVRRFCWLIMFAAIAIIPYDIRHKHRLTKFATHCWHRKPRYRFLPQTARYYLRWQSRKPRPLREPKQSGHSSKKSRFLSSTDRSFVRDDKNGLPRQASYSLLAIGTIHPAYYQRRSNYLLNHVPRIISSIWSSARATLLKKYHRYDRDISISIGWIPL